MTSERHHRRATPTATGRLKRLLRRSRPRFWLYTAGPVLVGVAHAAETTGDLVTPLTVGAFLYFLVPANVYLYGINDVFDADVDAENPKKGDAGVEAKNPKKSDGTWQANGEATTGDTTTDEPREVRYRGDASTLAAVAVSGLLGVGFVAWAPARAVPWFGGFLVLATAYSAPPFRLKTTPLLDSLSNGLYVLPGAGVYVAVAGANPPAAALVGAWLWTMAMHTFSAIPDVEPDRRAGIRTTATVLGERGALAYCGLVWLLAAVAFAVVDPRAGVLLAVYPALLAGIAVSGVRIDRAYWWFPAVNTAVGAVLTLAGLWGIVHG